MTTARRQRVAISVSGLRSQAALLTFGEAIEARFGVGAVRLVRTKGTADVFAATVSDDTDVAAALGDLPGFDILTAIRPSSRDATLMLAEVVAREVPSAPWAIREPAPETFEAASDDRAGRFGATLLSVYPLGDEHTRRHSGMGPVQPSTNNLHLERFRAQSLRTTLEMVDASRVFVAHLRRSTAHPPLP